jgi:C4-type Zn-finger protein
MKKGFEKKIEELDNRITEQSTEEKGLVATCAKCGSRNLTMTQTPAKVYFREIRDSHCRDCGYEGVPIFKKSKK